MFSLLFDLFRNKLYHATELPAIKPTVAEFLDRADALTFVMPEHDPDYPVFRAEDIVNVHENVPELEALMRWAMVLHNQYPWDRSAPSYAGPAEIGDDDFVVAFHPRNRDVMAFIDRVKRTAAAGHHGAGEAAPRPARHGRANVIAPAAPYPPVRVREAFAVQPKLEALAIVRGEHVCDNADVIRNASFSWSPMSADEISAKTGIRQRRYAAGSRRNWPCMRPGLRWRSPGPDAGEIGAVLVSTCTSNRRITVDGLLAVWRAWPAADARLRRPGGGLRGAALRAGRGHPPASGGQPPGPAGLRGEVLRQDRQRSHLADDLRGRRRGDGHRPGRPRRGRDVEVVQTYASGPRSEVNSIIWPNPEFDNDITVYGPEVKSLVQRYLAQMLDELGAQPDPDDAGRTLLESIELIVPHQANKTMILNLARQAGLGADRLYFNIERMGNVSAASIPIAVHDAVREGVIARPARVFAPGFGAGAVGGYAVLRIDPAIVADEVVLDIQEAAGQPAAPRMAGSTSDDIRAAFGE